MITVAEIGINHMGKVTVAKALISLAREFGADYVKFQKRNVEKVYARSALNRQKMSVFGNTKMHEKFGLEFGKPEYDDIDRHCRKVGIGWFASPWDVESLEFLEQYDLPYLKVASACLTNWKLLGRIAATKRPVILSCGMSNAKDIRRAEGMLGGHLAFILHCASEYPTSDEAMNMSGFDTLRKMFLKPHKYGVSLHNRRVIYIAQAASMGAEMVEFHITLDKAFMGDDQLASLAPGEFLKAMEHLKAIKTGWGNGKISPSAAELAKGDQYEWRRK